MTGEIEFWALKRLGPIPIRFDWFGSVKRSSKSGSVQPYLSLSCSALREPTDGEPSEAPDEKLLSVEVLIQWLRLFRLGDVWQNGKFLASESLKREVFKGLVVDDSTTSVGPCGKSSEGPNGARRHDLPFAWFSSHADHTLSYLVRVEAGPGLVLLVPSMELVRFYFGSSGALLGNIFSGPFAMDRLYAAASMNKSTGVANVTLAKGVPAIAATTVARIAFNPVAKRQIQNIINTGVRAAASGTPWYPRVSFPFTGITDLTAEGMWMESETERVFLVARLISCTHPFPFTKLYYKVSAETISKLVARPGISPNDGEESKHGRKSNDVSLDSGPQDASLAPARVAATPDTGEVPFPDLLTKKVARVKDDKERRAAGTPKPSSGGDDPINLTIGFNRVGASRSVDVSESASPLDSGIHEPDSLRRLREASASTIQDLIIRVFSPLVPTEPSARFEIKEDDGSILTPWASTFSFMHGHGDENSLLVMVVEDRSSEESPEMLAFDLRENLELGRDRLAAMARLFCTFGEERDALANEFRLVRAWGSESLTSGAEASVLEELVQYVLYAEWVKVDRSEALDMADMRLNGPAAPQT